MRVTGEFLETRAASAGGSRRQINACFEIVTVRVDEKGAIEWFSALPRFAIAARSKLEASRMELIDGFFRGCHEREMDWAFSRFMLGAPKTRTTCGNNKERRMADAGAEHKPSSPVPLSVVFQQPESERFQNSLIEPPSSFQIADDNSDVVEHAALSLTEHYFQ